MMLIFEDLAKSYNCPYFETSAKSGKNVTECFAQILREAYKSRISRMGGGGGSSGSPKCILL